MTRIKIDYGIDLGTTNSAISRMENGEPVIQKTDTQSDIMPSCVYINKKKAFQVGMTAFNKMKSDKLRAMKDFNSFASNSFLEFKRTMGRDIKYHSSNMEKDFLSEDLSAEVLKKLKSFISDESFKSIVISVPAKFTINQKDATVRAATLAGFNHCKLLQEPIAASMAYGLDAKSKDGYWLVFDFGGGTFDAALLKVEEGIIKVIDTEGDNYLGGKNLDYAIVDEIIIPHLQDNFVIDSIIEDDSKKKILQDAMKFYAEETKIQMSFNETYNLLSDLEEIPGQDDEGVEFELDITVTQEMMQNTLGPFYQKAIEICKVLLKRNQLDENSLDSLILVGGPTYSPILRKMLEERIIKPNVSVDPMTVVAEGAALFASTVDVSDEVKEQQRDKTKIQLKIGYESTTVETEELVTIIIEPEKMEGNIPGQVFTEIVRSDKAWSSGKIQISDAGEVIKVKLNESRPNAFNISLYDAQGDILECEPNKFTIIQGTKVGSATLPYNIGIDIKSTSSNRVIVTNVKGLDKNNTYPVTGVRHGLKTQKTIRPGIKDDFISISVYEMDDGAEGSRPIYNQKVFNAIITGEDLPALLPEGSEVDITVKCLGDGNISLSAHFPLLEHTQEIDYQSNIEPEIDDKYLDSEIQRAKQSLTMIEQEGAFQDKEELNSLNSEIQEVEKSFQHGRNDSDRKKETLERLKRKFRRIDNIIEATEWPKTEEELKEVFYRLEETNQQFGSDKTSALVEQFKEQIPELIKEKNVKVAQELIDNMRSLDYVILREKVGFWVGFIHNFNENFDTIEWTDKNRARMVLDDGLRMAANNPTKERLEQVINELYKLMIDPKEGIVCKDCGNPINKCTCHLEG